MKNQAEIRKQLIQNTIQIVARGGFQEATTKALTSYNAESLMLKINEAYIYRLFGSKEGLYAGAFNMLDESLFVTFWQRTESLAGFGKDTMEIFYSLFTTAWDFILKNEENCRYYVRFYHSVYFRGEVLACHQKAFAQIISRMSHIFKEETNVTFVMHSVFTTMLNFATQVFNGELLDTADNRERIFHMLYCMMMTYLKE